MARRLWGKAEVALLKQYVQSGLNCAEIVDKFQKEGVGRTYKAVQRKIEAQRRKGEEGWQAQLTPGQFFLSKPYTLEGDTVIYCDPHAPFHHADWMNRVTTLAVKWGIKKAAIPGDLVDFSIFSYFGRQMGIEFEDEVQSACHITKALAVTFDEVVICGGNHEKRMIRRMKHDMSLGAVLNQFIESQNVTMTPKYWFWLDSAGQRFRVGHPGNYNRRPTYTARRLAEKYRCHVILGHNHLWGITREISNNNWAIDAGHCANVKKLAYLEEVMMTNPEQVSGAVIVRDGIPVLLSPDNIGFYESIKV